LTNKDQRDTAANKSRHSKVDLEQTKSSVTSSSKSSVANRNKQNKSLPPRINQTFEDDYRLPERYDDTSITLISRDPYSMHAYWEIADKDIKKVQKKIGRNFKKSTRVLRVYDVTCVDFNGKNANQSFDIDVNSNAGNWYINLWCDNAIFCSDLGYKTPKGDFVSVARSNYVGNPRASTSWRSEMIWMNVKDNVVEQPYVNIEASKKQEKNKSVNIDQNKFSPEETQEISQQIVNKIQKRIPLSIEDIKTFYLKLFPLLKVIKLKKSDAPKGFLPQDFENITIEDAKLIELKEGDLYKKIFLGASESWMLENNRSSEQTQLIGKVGASEREEQERKFFFEVGTDLIVYGRTEPDA